MTIERIKETSAKIDGALPCTGDLVAATKVMSTELAELSVLLKMAESEDTAAKEHSEVVSAAAVAHAEKLLLYNAEKDRHYEKSESEKR